MTTIAAAAIVDALAKPTRLLAARRTAPQPVAGLWEFPGGKVEPGETAELAAVREVFEELGVRIRLGAELLGHTGPWRISRSKVLRLFLAEIIDGDPQPLEDHDQLRWLDFSQSHSIASLVPWLDPDVPMVHKLESSVISRGSSANG